MKGRPQGRLAGGRGFFRAAGVESGPGLGYMSWVAAAPALMFIAPLRGVPACFRIAGA